MKIQLTTATLTLFDPEQLSETVSGGEFQHLQISPGPFYGQLLRAQFGESILDAGIYSQNLIVKGSFPDDRVVLGMILNGSQAGWLNGVHFAPNDVVVIAEGASMDPYKMPAGTQWIGFQTSREILERHQLKLPARSQTAFHSRLSPEVLQLSQSLMALVTTQFTCQQSKPKNGLLLGDELIAGFRQAIDASRDANQRLYRPYNHVRGTLLKKLEEAIEGHLQSDLRIPDLCEYIGVGQRTLESFCNDYYGMPPKRYLSVRRLNALRDCLLRAAQSDLSIAELAGTFRFTHPGRFSKIYWSHFGELPSHTLRHR